MALTGHLSDLSLSELIEFFCNQRKSGRLRVLYPQGSGYFYLQAGSVVDARIGTLRGIDAVYYALTLANAKFEFSGSAEAPDRTINQPWTQVVLEGLRRLDEGITPADAFPEGFSPEMDEIQVVKQAAESESIHPSHVPAFLSFMGGESTNRKPMVAVAIAVAILASVAAIGVPAGWYSRANVAAVAAQPPVAAPVEAPPVVTATPEAVATQSPEASSNSEDAAALAARRQRERDRARARDEKAALSGANGANNSGPKKVAVTVTYDESGRVIQASGGDASALRIARQKRFPPGKAGSATVTIPIN
ncbi:MAG: DUF4388 domain-containing protein [Pyrinomonadaceae bacterium]